MAISAPEYREQLLAQGCNEGLADAIISLVEAARDDAEAEVIIKLGERLDEHIAQNDQQFRDSDSAIRETARELTDLINQRTAEIKLEVAKALQIVADLRVENERQFAKIQIENERGRRENAEAFSKAQNRLSYAAIGIAALIVGAAAAIITAVAFLV